LVIYSGWKRRYPEVFNAPGRSWQPSLQEEVSSGRRGLRQCLAGTNGSARCAYRALRDVGRNSPCERDTDRSGTGERAAADGDSTLVDDADIEPDRIDDPLAADDDGLDEDPTGL